MMYNLSNKLAKEGKIGLIKINMLIEKEKSFRERDECSLKKPFSFISGKPSSTL